jgi:N-carbamoylputrescine amidase
MTSHADTNARSGLITVACLQMRPTFGDVAANVADSLRMIDQAAERGADLVVLPELCNSGYVFASRGEAFALAEEIPSGPTVKAWAERAARHRLYLVAGICERAGGNLYNSAVVLGPEGYLGTFRKVHLWNEETLYFEPGDLGFPVFHTPIGRIGVAICYDGWFPETYRLCALQGADIVCVPTNWVPIPGQAAGRQAMANILAMGAAHSNSMFIACADRVGVERGQPFEGRASSSVTPDGLSPGRPAGIRKKSSSRRSISARPGANATGTPSTRCCAIGAPTSTTRCSAAPQSAVGTDLS